MNRFAFGVLLTLAATVPLFTGMVSCGDDNPVNGDDTGDTVRPRVIATVPTEGDSTVSVNTVISATFSEDMDPGSMTAGVIVLDPSTDGTTGYSARTVTFTPSAALDTNVTYTATVVTSARDTAGNSLAAPYTWQFSTYRDSIPPTVISTHPADGDSATVNTTLSVLFSEPMDISTLTLGSLVLDPPAAGIVTPGGDTQMVFTPDAPLDTFQLYTATVTTAVRDSAGNSLAADYTWQFRTVRDWIPPAANLLTPGDNAVFDDSLIITIDAVDNDSVAKVEFHIDGVHVPGADDTSPPYAYTWRPAGLTMASEHAVFAVVYDAAGNSTATDTVTVHYLWRLLVEDFNEAIPRNLSRIYARSSRTQLQFRVETYNGWGDYTSPTEGIDVAIFLDIDQDSSSGQTYADNGTRRIGDIGTEYRIVVGNHGDVLDYFNGSSWVPQGTVDGLVITDNSNFFEVAIDHARIGDPAAIDLIAANVILSTFQWDWAPDVDLGHVTLEIDRSFTGSPPMPLAFPEPLAPSTASRHCPFD